jgi:hypothetical protein
MDTFFFYKVILSGDTVSSRVIMNIVQDALEKAAGQ